MVPTPNMTSHSVIDLLNFNDNNNFNKECLAELTEINISDKRLQEIPEVPNICKKLQKLSIASNFIKLIPDSFGELSSLQTLDLSENELKSVPESLSKLKNLENLNLSSNKLEDLPVCYTNLHQLRTLDISNNKFKTIPSCVANGLQFLKVLNVSNNVNIKLNVKPQSLYLEKFIARDNKNCGIFPDWLLLHNFCDLKELHLDNTRFDIYNFHDTQIKLNLKVLSINSSNVSYLILEKLTKNMVKLEKIYAENSLDNTHADNCFGDIPIYKISHPELITELNFSATGVASVPVIIKNFINLIKLDISYNNIPWLPNEFCLLSNLKVLKMNKIGLICLPEDFGNLDSLEEICLIENHLAYLPESFVNLQKLKFIDLYDNYFEEIPFELDTFHELKGLDLEINHFNTQKIQINKEMYDNLRKNLFLHYNISDRMIGHKEKEENVVDLEDNVRDYWIHSDSDDCDYEVGDFAPVEVVQVADDENWDTEKDFNDSFDPTAEKLETFEEIPPAYDLTIRGNFCPADLHARQVKHEVAQMRLYGSLPRDFDIIEEGQFDDG